MKKKMLGDMIICHFNYDEELSLARSVMHTLSQRWITNSVCSSARALYDIGCSGNSPMAEVLLVYLDIISKDDRLSDVKIIDDGTNLPSCPKEVFEKGATAMQGWYTKQRRLAWHEAWEENRKGLASIDDYYQDFPGDSLEDRSEYKLKRFFNEVYVSLKRYKMGMDQAYIETMDRFPHCDLSKQELMDIQGEYWDNAKIAFDINFPNYDLEDVKWENVMTDSETYNHPDNEWLRSKVKENPDADDIIKQRQDAELQKYEEHLTGESHNKKMWRLRDEKNMASKSPRLQRAIQAQRKRKF